MNKIKSIFSTIAIVICSYFKGLRKVDLNKVKKGSILIPYANIFGDIVLLLDCIDEFDKLYPKDKGYDVTFICRPSIKKFILSIYPDCKLKLVTVDWAKFTRDYSYYKEVVEQYVDVYEKVIVPYDHTATNDFFVRSIYAKEKITQDYDIPHKKYGLTYLVGRNTYTQMITVNKNISVLERQRILINTLGNKDFKSRMPYIKPLEVEKISVPDSYIVLAPTASYPPKRWELTKFAATADYFVDKYGCKVCICGGNEEPDIFCKMADIVKHPEMLVDCVNRTNFAQWAELMRGAKIAICNDSASYHLAAAVRTPAVCIAGDFACVNAPLYEPDIIEEYDRVPTVVYRKMPCEGCRYIGYHYGYSNKQCLDEIKKGNAILCVQMIGFDEVIAECEKLISKYNVDF